MVTEPSPRIAPTARIWILFGKLPNETGRLERQSVSCGEARGERYLKSALGNRRAPWETLGALE